MKKTALIILFLFISIISFSQIDYYEHPENKPDTSVLFRKFVYGGSLGIGFGNYTRIAFSPKIAYPITNWFTAGVGADFLYYNTNTFKSFMYGVNGFVELTAFNFLTAHAEYALLNVESFSYYLSNYNQPWNTAIYVGGGYKQRISDRSYITYLILWDLNYSGLTPYPNPDFRFTFYF